MTTMYTSANHVPFTIEAGLAYVNGHKYNSVYAGYSIDLVDGEDCTGCACEAIGISPEDLKEIRRELFRAKDREPRRASCRSNVVCQHPAGDIHEDLIESIPW